MRYRLTDVSTQIGPYYHRKTRPGGPGRPAGTIKPLLRKFFVTPPLIPVKTASFTFPLSDVSPRPAPLLNKTRFCSTLAHAGEETVLLIYMPLLFEPIMGVDLPFLEVD